MQERQLVSVRLSRELWQRVRLRAVERGVSAASIVEEALGQWMGERRQGEGPSKAFERPVKELRYEPGEEG